MVVTVIAPDEGALEMEDRILDAALLLVARWGVGKTSLSDVAKEAGCARATVYRAFPGGRQQMFAALGARELAGYLTSIIEVIDSADTLEDAVTSGLVVASRLLSDHDAAQFALAHEPEILTPFLGFKEVDRIYGHVSATVGPHLERLIPARQAERAERSRWLAEWAARAFITYLFNPAVGVDLSSVDDARRLVSSFMIPAFEPTIDLTELDLTEVDLTNPDLQPTRQPLPYGSTHVHH